MKIITVNLNGIRAAARKGFFDWLPLQNADVVCMQETKAQLAKLTDLVFRPNGYALYFHDAERAGYSGVAIYSRYKPKKVTTGLGWQAADDEGRYVQLDFNNLSIASIYLPSGSSSEARQQIKFDFMKKYEPLLKKISKHSHPFVICGDWNIVHKEIDIKNWKSNQKNSGCLPEERAWLDKVFGDIGLVDAFREVNKEANQYTWWSNRGQAREKNVGWRIDYQVVTNSLKSTVKSAKVYKNQWFSDHAPLIMEYDFEIEL